MEFNDLYEALGITYRYQSADIIKSFKQNIHEYFEKNNSTSEKHFVQLTINFLLLEDAKKRHEYDLYYYDFYKVNDNQMLVKDVDFTEADNKLFLEKLELWRNELLMEAENLVKSGETIMVKNLKDRYKKLMFTTKNIVLFILATLLIIGVLFLMVIEAIHQIKTNRFNKGIFIIYSMMLLVGFGVYCNIWYSVHF